MPRGRQAKFPQALWSFLSSLKFTVILLTSLFVVFVVGSIFQNKNFVDIYHSWWIVGLLGMLMINFVCGSIFRFIQALSVVRHPHTIQDKTFSSSLRNVGEYCVDRSLLDVQAAAKNILSRQFARSKESPVENGVVLFAQKHVWVRFAASCVSFAVATILFGLIVGNLSGYEGSVEIDEGGSANRILLKDGAGFVPLDFTLVCEKVMESTDASTSSAGSSILSVYEDNLQVVARVPVTTTEPLIYRGISFKQSSYRRVGEPSFVLKVESRKSSFNKELKIVTGKVYPLPTGGRLRVIDFTPTLQGRGPAVKVEFRSAGGATKNLTLVQGDTVSGATQGMDYIFSLVEYDKKFSTTLLVKKETGGWIVLVGSVLLILGLLVALFGCHRCAWITLIDQENQIIVSAFIDDFRVLPILNGENAKMIADFDEVFGQMTDDSSAK